MPWRHWRPEICVLWHTVFNRTRCRLQCYKCVLRDAFPRCCILIRWYSAQKQQINNRSRNLPTLLCPKPALFLPQTRKDYKRPYSPKCERKATEKDGLASQSNRQFDIVCCRPNLVAFLKIHRPNSIRGCQLPKQTTRLSRQKLCRLISGGATGSIINKQNVIELDTRCSRKCEETFMTKRKVTQNTWITNDVNYQWYYTAFGRLDDLLNSTLLQNWRIRILYPSIRATINWNGV